MISSLFWSNSGSFKILPKAVHIGFGISSALVPLLTEHPSGFVNASNKARFQSTQRKQLLRTLNYCRSPVRTQS